MLQIAVPKETAAHENRVALSPAAVSQLIKDEHQVLIEKGAGDASNFLDQDYADAGATIATNRNEIFSQADLVLAVQTPSEDDLGLMKKGSTLICFLWALQHPKLVEKLKSLGITALGMDAIPRISRAQNMDALSSMSSIAGYKAALMPLQNWISISL